MALLRKLFYKYVLKSSMLHNSVGGLPKY